MSMSDCPKCWNTPCTCGWAYRDWPKAHLQAMINMFQTLLDGTHEYSLENSEKEEKDG